MVAFQDAGRVRILHVWTARILRHACVLHWIGICFGWVEPTLWSIVVPPLVVVLGQVWHSVRIATIRWPAGRPSVIVAIKNGMDFDKSDFAVSLLPDGMAALLVFGVDPCREVVLVTPAANRIPDWLDRPLELVAGTRVAFGEHVRVDLCRGPNQIPSEPAMEALSPGFRAAVDDYLEARHNEYLEARHSGGT